MTLPLCQALELWLPQRDDPSRSPSALLATRLPKAQSDFPRGAPGAGSDPHPPADCCRRSGVPLRPSGQREPDPRPRRRPHSASGARRPTSRQAGPLPRTWRALTNPVLLPLGRDPAGHGGDLAPWRRRLRRLQLLGRRPPPPRGAPARPGLLRHVPVNLGDPAGRLSAALRRPRSPGIRCGCSRARGHLLGRAAAPPSAPLRAPPRPLPPAAPSARLRAPTGLSRRRSPARASLCSAWRTSRSSFPVQTGV